jgi:hypothetical protein
VEELVVFVFDHGEVAAQVGFDVLQLLSLRFEFFNSLLLFLILLLDAIFLPHLDHQVLLELLVNLFLLFSV